MFSAWTMVLEALQAWDIELAAETGANAARAFNPCVIRGDHFQLAGYISDWNRFGPVTTGSNHDAENFVVDELDCLRAQASRQQPIGCGRRASALHVTENGNARFQVREFLKLLGKTQRVAGMPRG